VESEEDVRIRREMDKVALGEPQSTSVNVTLHHVKGEDVGIPAASRNKKVAKRNHRSNLLVPGGGVEPPRAKARRILSPLRLPVPPSRLFVEVLDSTANCAFYFVAIPNDKCETV
jgi:hypothetical protein